MKRGAGQTRAIAQSDPHALVLDDPAIKANAGFTFELRPCPGFRMRRGAPGVLPRRSVMPGLAWTGEGRRARHPANNARLGQVVGWILATSARMTPVSE